MNEPIKKDDQKFYNMLGLAQKAGKVKSGSETMLRELKKKNIRLLIISSDASENTVKRFKERSEAGGVPIIFVGEAKKLGKAIGKDERSVAGICDAGFAKALLQ